MHESCDYYYSPSSTHFCEDVREMGAFTLLHNAAPEIMDKINDTQDSTSGRVFCFLLSSQYLYKKKKHI